jgi:hypothetical protein
MSRTNKDKPSKIRYSNKWQVPDLPKIPKWMDDTWHWLQSTPSWWTNMFMNRPQRHKARRWEREVQKINDLDELEDIDTPNVSKKPHVYYW